MISSSSRGTLITNDWMDGGFDMNETKAVGCPPVLLRQGSV